MGMPRRNLHRSLYRPVSGQHSASHPRSLSDAAPQLCCRHQHPLPRVRRTRRPRRSLRHRKNSRLPHSALRCQTQKYRPSTRVHAPTAPPHRRRIRTHERPRRNGPHCLQLHRQAESRRSPPQPHRAFHLAPPRCPCRCPAQDALRHHQPRVPPRNRLPPPPPIHPPPLPRSTPRPPTTNPVGTGAPHARVGTGVSPVQPSEARQRVHQQHKVCPVFPRAPVAKLLAFLRAPRALRVSAVKRFLHRPLKQRHRQRQRHHRKYRQINHVWSNRRQPRFLQQQRLESMHRIGKRIHLGNRPQPRRKSLYRIDRSAGKKQQRIQNPKHRPRHQRILDPHHQQKHHRIERRRGQHDHRHQPQHRPRMEYRPHSRQQRSDRRSHHPGHHRLDRPCPIQPKHQLRLCDRSHQIPLVHPACLIVDIQHPPADHHRHEHRQCDRSRQQILHVFDIRIQLHHLQRRLLQQPRRHVRLVQGVRHFSHLVFERRTHEVVAVVHDQRDPRMILLVHHLRVLRRNNHRSLNLPVAYVLPRLHFVVIRNRNKRPRIRPHRVKRFLDPDRLRPMILIHDPHLCVADLSAKRIPQHDQLHQRHHHRHHHQRRRPEKLAHLALDNRHHPVHGRNPGLSGIVNACAFTSSSRNCRPV